MQHPGFDLDRAIRELLKGRSRYMRRILWIESTGSRRQRKLTTNRKIRLLRCELAGVEPSSGELVLLAHLGRAKRLVDQGATLVEAVAALFESESSDDYVRRNREAMESLEKRLLSPAYLERFLAMQSEPDPLKRTKLGADLKRENFEVIDMAAVHRTISARNRQWKAEGIIP